MLLLGLASYFGIDTAGGAFQRLVKLWTTPLFVAGGVDILWSRLQLPDPASTLFMSAFKVSAGLLMAFVYAAIEPGLPGRWWAKGLIYAMLIWLINASIVLPLLGEGFAGWRSLTPTGMVAFAFAHTSFFLVLAAFAHPPAAKAEFT